MRPPRHPAWWTGSWSTSPRPQRGRANFARWSALRRLDSTTSPAAARPRVADPEIPDVVGALPLQNLRHKESTGQAANPTSRRLAARGRRLVCHPFRLRRPVGQRGRSLRPAGDVEPMRALFPRAPGHAEARGALGACGRPGLRPGAASSRGSCGWGASPSSPTGSWPRRWATCRRRVHARRRSRRPRRGPPGPWSRTRCTGGSSVSAHTRKNCDPPVFGACASHRDRAGRVGDGLVDSCRGSCSRPPVPVAVVAAMR